MLLLDRGMAAQAAAERKALAAQQAGPTSGRPAYANTFSSLATLKREVSFQLLSQFYDNITLLPRTTAILSGFVGCPEIIVPDDENGTDDLQQWAASVPFGYAGQGIEAWKNDHLAQCLLYGFAVGEAQLAGGLNEIERLWSYDSPTIGFRTDPSGAITIIQHTGIVGGQKPLNPETVVHTAHNPRGANPNGRSLFMAIPLVAQAWMDVVHAHRETWRRNGIPIYWFHWVAPDNLNDPTGSKCAAVRGALEDNWNEAMRSQVVDGKAKDFFSAGSGDTKLQVIGADGAVMDIEISNRVMMEQLVAATGIPPSSFGFSWSTSERMSRQQMEMLVATIDALRNTIEPTLLRILRLRQRLAGKKNPDAVELRWRDVTLQDERETAFAAHFDALAQRSRQSYARQLWADGIWDQEKVAEYLTDDETVATPQDAPVPLVQPGDGQGDGAGQNARQFAHPLGRQVEGLLGSMLQDLYRAEDMERGDGPSLWDSIEQETLSAYPVETFKHACNGKH